MSGARGAGRFSFRMSAEDAQGVVGAFKQVAGQSDELKRAFDRLIQASPQLASVNDNVQRKMRETADAMKTTQSAGTSLAGIIGSAGVLGVAVGAGAELFRRFSDAISSNLAAIPKAGDELKSYEARLVSATGSGAQAVAVLGQLARVAQRTGAGLGDTVDAFSRFNIAAKNLGATSDEVVRLVEGIQKFAIVSGTSGQGLSAATTQLAQALASGRLQGDELRSILENMPELAAALARQLGVSMGALRQMGSEGKLSAEVVFPALSRAVGDIEKKFADMPLTMERAMGGAEIATNRLLASLDSTLDISGRIARTWEGIARLMDRLRIGTGGATPDEALVGLQAEQNQAQIRRDEIARRLQNINAPDNGMNRFDRADQRSRAERDLMFAQRKLDEVNSRIAQVEADQRARIGIEGERAFIQGMEGRRSGSQESVQRLMDLDSKGKAKREFDKDMAALDEARRLGTVTTEQFEKLSAVLSERFAKAMSEGAKATKTQTEEVAEFLKQRDKIDAAGRAAELALDPYAAAWERAAAQVRDLTAAMELWEQSAGARGLAPERAQELIAQTQTGLIDTFGKLERGVDNTDRAFTQFFSNAISGFEDAAARGASFGEILQSLEQDIARLIIRMAVLEPLSEAANAGKNYLKGFLKDQGGVSGIAKTGFDFISSFFADGGVMTDKGPLPLRRYASGGIADSPQLAMFGEGATPEAYVPLPDGRAIPVRMQGGRGDTIINVTVGGSNSSPALIAGTVALAVEQAQARIYGDADRGGSAARRLGRRR